MKNLSDLREDEDEVSLSQQQEDVLIVGTVFKQQERKPSILKELSEPSEDGELSTTDVARIIDNELNLDWIVQVRLNWNLPIRSTPRTQTALSWRMRP